MVELLIQDTGEKIEVVNSKIRYVKTAADLGDVTKLNSSYTWSMKAPKSPNNIRLFKFLSTPGDASSFPYEKTKVSLIDNGFPILINALITVRSTNDHFKIHLQEGVIEFINILGNSKISEAIDLIELDHQNTIQTIIASFTANLPYKYIIASYNGQPLANITGTTNLVPNAILPSINVKYLWDKIFENYGWTYTGSFDISNDWMSYPKATAYDPNDKVLVGDWSELGYEGETIEPQSLLLPLISTNNLNEEFFSQGNDGGRFFPKKTGNYRFTLSINGVFDYDVLNETEFDFFLLDSQNNIESNLSSSADGEAVLDCILNANSGPVLAFIIIPDNFPPPVADYGKLKYDVDLKIELLGVEDVSFTSALIKYSVKDFFKEIMIRNSLTAFTDVENKRIDFLTQDERLSAPVVDWSDKYVKRKDEKYIYENYGQNNYFRHKYDVDGQDFNDGILLAENENLPVQKTLYQSKSYSPLQELVPYQDNGTIYYVNNFKMFDVEIKEDTDTGDLIANYKPLKERFYFMKSEEVDNTIYILGDQVNGFPLATLSDSTFDVIVDEKYSKISEILSNTRVHEIELALSKVDVINTDLKKVYYFKQEHAYYLLESLSWESGKTCTGKFTKINRGS